MSRNKQGPSEMTTEKWIEIVRSVILRERGNDPAIDDLDHLSRSILRMHAFYAQYDKIYQETEDSWDLFELTRKRIEVYRYAYHVWLHRHHRTYIKRLEKRFQKRSRHKSYFFQKIERVRETV